MEKPIRCLIVDDEPVARDILRTYCSHLPFLTVAGEYGNALDARQSLLSTDIDLLFLDINMPVLSGTAFLQTLKHPPLIIFTTAYQEYAVQAFDLSACDYLLKPFTLERFIQAVAKVKERLTAQPANASSVIPATTSSERDHLFVRAEGQLHKVVFHDLLYAEAQSNYTKIITTENILLTKSSFSAFIAQLPGDLFIQVHRSFIVNLRRISRIEGNRVWLHRHEVPIAAPYKPAFLKAIGLSDQP
jgi:DNA-binding LytR/AlgR family response regulator